MAAGTSIVAGVCKEGRTVTCGTRDAAAATRSPNGFLAEGSTSQAFSQRRPPLERRAQVLDRAVDSRPCIAQERIGVPSVVRQVHVVDECAEWRAQSVQQRREDDTIGSNGGSR